MLPRAFAASLFLALVLAVPSYAASKPRARTTLIPIQITKSKVTAGTSRTEAGGRLLVPASSLCQLGIPDPRINLVDYIYPPEDSYFTLLNQDDCFEECPAPAIMKVESAHVVLAFAGLPCSVSVDVSLLRSTGSAACPVPNRSQVICGPFSFLLVAPQVGGEVDFSMPMPGTCAFTGKAFLQIVVQDLSPDCAAQGDRPLIVAADYCDQCTSYNLFGTVFEDLCGPENGFPGNPLMYADMLNCALADAPDDAPMTGVRLGSGFPNPAPGAVTIEFALPRATTGRLRVYDVAGSLVKTITEGALAAGEHKAVWDRSTDQGGRARPGMYYYELRTEGVRIARRIVMLK